MKSKFNNFDEIKDWYTNEINTILTYLSERKGNSDDFNKYCCGYIEEKYNSIKDCFYLEAEEKNLISELRKSFYNRYYKLR